MDPPGRQGSPGTASPALFVTFPALGCADTEKQRLGHTEKSLAGPAATSAMSVHACLQLPKQQGLAHSTGSIPHMPAVQR